MKSTIRIISFLCFLTVTQLGHAQSGGNQGAFEFGIQHSINFTGFTGDYNQEQIGNKLIDYKPLKRRTTFDLGLFATSYFSNALALQFEAYYSYMGAHMRKTTTVLHDVGKFEGEENESFAMDYIRVPISLIIHPNDKMFIQAGGYVGSLISSHLFYPWNALKTRTTLEGINSFDAGIIAGFGLNTNIVRLSFRYTHGLQDVFKENQSLNLNHSVMQFVAQWKLFSDLRK